MKKTLVIKAVCIALYAGLPSPSVADESQARESSASDGTVIADLERRIEELEAKIGGGTVTSAFQPRSRKDRHLRVPAQP